MPIYEYCCEKCGGRCEHIQSFLDKPLKKCKRCGGRLRKLVSECSFHLKGSGWYVTDYCGKKPGGNGKPKKDEEKPAELKPESTKKPPEQQKHAS